MKLVVSPCATVRVAGLMEPPSPALALTMYCLSEKLALTAQVPVTTPVVYVLPESVPPQPLTESMS